ncbi:MAG TPA: hypothetical protein VIL30_03630 [Ramlibacter sp.]|jgi:hypothetical protein
MADYATPLERAFELARSGKYTSITDIKAQLEKEHISIDQINGPVLVRQLREIIAEAAAKRATAS